MPEMNIFDSDPFSVFELTDMVQRVPYAPNYLGSLGLFTSDPIRTTTIGIERQQGKLALIKTSQRGGPPDIGDRTRGKLYRADTVRLAKRATIYAHELQNIRSAVRDGDNLLAAQEEVLKHVTSLRQDMELTHENMRMGAITGRVLDADGSLITDWFDVFGLTAPAPIPYNFTDSNFDIQLAVTNQTRALIRALGGNAPANVEVIGLCGDTFFNQLMTHPNYRGVYKQAGIVDPQFRNFAFASIEAFGITWVNYRGTDDIAMVGVATNECRFILRNVPNLFKVAWSPMENFQFANTLGQPIYSMIVRDRDRDMWASPEIYSYPLYICTVPEVLQRGVAS